MGCGLSGFRPRVYLGQAGRSECASCERTHACTPRGHFLCLEDDPLPMTQSGREAAVRRDVHTSTHTLVYTDLPFPFRTCRPCSERRLNCPLLPFPTGLFTMIQGWGVQRRVEGPSTCSLPLPHLTRAEEKAGGGGLVLRRARGIWGFPLAETGALWCHGNGVSGPPFT